MTNPRGAPPGNHNALKHGFYARQLKGVDLKGLDPHSALTLEEDIAMLRVYIRRLLDHAQEPLSFPDAVSFTRVLCLAYLSLSRLVKTEHLLTGTGNPIQDALRQVVTEMAIERERMKEAGLVDPPESPSSPYPPLSP